MKYESHHFPRPNPLPDHRWSPLRCGFLNIYKYDEEVFVFERGRLLHRGNNGSGKSRSLALQLPFLFDGDISPHRVEPDGDPSKRFEWNLLMGKHQDRTGYTWIEFGRIDENGVEHYCTLGSGLRAVEGRGIADKWFFITSQRIGDSLNLTTAAGTPVGKATLELLLGMEGKAYEVAALYREAVDQKLFGLGKQRYKALIDLQIQLRKPQLSRDFDDKFLSGALSDALSPLDEEALSFIADAYRGLESDREQLNHFVAAQKAVEEFLGEYTHYARIASKRRATNVRTAHSAYEKTQREVKTAKESLEEAQEKIHKHIAAIDTLTLKRTDAESRIKVLEGSAEMRSARELQNARDERAKSQLRLTDAGKDLSKARDSLSKAAQKLSGSKEKVDKLTESFLEEARVARIQAKAASFDTLTIPEGLVSLDDFLASTRSVDSILKTRAQVLRELEDLHAELLSMQKHLESARRDQARAAEAHSDAEGSLREAQRLHEEAVASLEVATRAWIHTLKHIQLGDTEALLGDLHSWTQSCEGDSPVRTILDHTLQILRDQVSKQEETLRASHERFDQERAETDRQIQLLKSGHHSGPAARSGVNSELRKTLPGAPLWKLLDFQDGIAPDVCAGIEAALEASGLLDAWVLPGGSVLSQDQKETLFSASAPSSRLSGANLSFWLKPSVDRGNEQSATITDEVLTGILDQIGISSEAKYCTISQDGAWKLGPLEGRWSKANAEHIGEGAREMSRRTKLAELFARLKAIEENLEANRSSLSEIEKKRQVLLKEAQGLPSTEACNQALMKCAHAQDQLTKVQEKLARADEVVVQARNGVDSVKSVCNESARGYGLLPWVDRLTDLRTAGTAFVAAFEGLKNEHKLYCSQREHLASLQDSHDTAFEQHEHCLLANNTARQEFTTFEAKCDELETTIGAGAEEVFKRHANTKELVRTLTTQIEAKTEEKNREGKEEARLEERLSLLQEQRNAQEQDRTLAIDQLTFFEETGLLQAASADLVRSKDASTVSDWVELARRIDSTLHKVDESNPAWDRRNKAIFSQYNLLQSTLGALSYRPDSSNEGDLFVVRIPIHQQQCSVKEAEAIFAQEIEQRQNLLKEQERAIIENHLLGEISVYIHDRLHEAEKWVEGVNLELAERPTSTGMKLSFEWELHEEGPSGFKEVRKHLLRSPTTWSDEHRNAVADFLYHRLQAEKENQNQRTWLDMLTSAFDYRKWHRFSVMREQERKKVRLTKKTFGTGSGGEKALMLTMPQFAAASAHYRSARKTAPRLIMLDEAFVGIDNDSRSKAMGLLTIFDIDLVMTSEREWGCYPEVSGIAIYQLHSQEGVDAVLATRWVWDGTRKKQGFIAKTSPGLYVSLQEPLQEGLQVQ